MLKPIFSHVTLALLTLLMPLYAAPSPWKSIGLDSLKVTSVGVVNFFGNTIILAGTEHSGVFQKSGSTPFVQLKGDTAKTFPDSLLNVKALFFPFGEDSPTFFAASDKGLYRYRFTSGVAAAWVKIDGLNAIPVKMVTVNKTLIAITETAIATSSDEGESWATVIYPFSTDGYHPQFTSIDSYMGTIFIGSDQFIGNSLPWIGIGISRDQGKTWEPFNNFTDEIKPIGPVYDLITYQISDSKDFVCLAATTKGLYEFKYREINSDTASWKPLLPRFPDSAIKKIYHISDTKALISTLFAITGNGLYVSQCSIWDQGDWIRLSPPVHDICADTRLNANRYYVATDKGVYTFSAGELAEITAIKSSPVLLKHVAPDIVSALNGTLRNIGSHAVAVYLPNGRLYTTLLPGATSKGNLPGIYLYRTLR